MTDPNKDTEWWWIDYLEDELDATLDRDLGLLLEHSQEDRDSFENFRLLKQWVRDSDPVGNWPVEARLDRMRSKIMDAIEQTEIEKPTTARWDKSLSVEP